MKRFVVYSTPSVRDFFINKLSLFLPARIGRPDFGKYPDGQTHVSLDIFPDSNEDVIVVSNTQGDKQLVELLALLHTARRNKNPCSKLIVVIPYFGAGRQDRAKVKGQDVSAKMQATLISAMKPDTVFLMDLHNEGIREFFDEEILVEELYAEPVFVEVIKSLDMKPGTVFSKDFVFASPDAGRLNWARSYAKKFDAEAVSLDKRRDKTGVKILNVIGDVRGKNIVMVDDILDTGETVFSGARALKTAGAKDIHLFVTHLVLSGDSYKRFVLDYSPFGLFASLHATDTIMGSGLICWPFNIHSVANIFAERIKQVFL